MRRLAFAALAAFAAVVSAAGVVLENGGFEQGEKTLAAGWQFTGAFQALAGEGHNGNRGAVWAAKTHPGKLHYAAQTLKGVRPGDLVKMSALVRKEDFRTEADQGAVMSIEWHDKDHKWIKALYALTRAVPDREWGVVQATGLMPANAKYAVMRIYVSGDSVGKIAWDNVEVSVLTGDPVQAIVTPVYRNTAAAGRVGFHASILPPANAPEPLSAKFAWTDASGATRTAPAARLTADEAYGEIDVADMAFGRHAVACELYAGGRRVGRNATDFTRVAELPRRRVWMDEHRRCIVDGKPFFPLGMYWNPAPRATTTPEDGLTQLDWFTNGPFNCVIHYEMMTPARLDFCRRAGLMSMSGVEPQLRDRLTGRLDDPSPEETRKTFLARVAAIKNHPALLGWYVADEVDVGRYPAQRKLYRILSDADEHHPIYGVQDRTYDLRPFADTVDVVGLDPYPVCRRPTRVVTEMLRAGEAAVFSSRPFWGVPQAFDWAWYRAKHEKIERFPSCAEMRSMNWQMIANGVNGLFLFAFNCYFYKLNVDDWRPRFAAACAAAREVRRMSDVLLSVDPAPKGTPNTDQAVCRTWAKDGRVYVLVCNLSENPRDVVVDLDAGSWRMGGAEVGTPATMAGPRRVSFYLDAIGVSLVRLEPNRADVHAKEKETGR